jgi:hypothetical protein
MLHHDDLREEKTRAARRYNLGAGGRVLDRQHHQLCCADVIEYSSRV